MVSGRVDLNASPEPPRWYVLRSRPKGEHLAAARLRLIDLEVFCPRLRFKRPTVRGPKWFTEAMFPGYIFARFEFWPRHREVRSTPGVAGILQFGGKHPFLEDEVIATLRTQTDDAEVVEVQPQLSEGLSVQVAQGSLRGFEAVVTRVLPGKERVRILLNFLGREVEAEVAKPDVLPPKQHPLAR